MQRQIYKDFTGAVTQIHQCLERRDMSSRLYQHLRKKIDDLSPQLTAEEHEAAYWFSLSLDHPGEGAICMKGSGDETE